MTTPLPLSAAHWAILDPILQRHIGDREIWAFGSRVSGAARPYSDLDLAIIGDTPLPFTTLAALKEDLSDSDLPWKVDIVDWAATAPWFRDVIRSNKTPLRLPASAG